MDSGKQMQLQSCASKQHQDDAPANHVPVAVHGDGNCLFRAANVNVFCHEDAYTDTRKKVASELH